VPHWPLGPALKKVSVSRQAADLFLDHQFLLFQARDFQIVRCRAALQALYRIGQDLVFFLQLLNVRTQAHGRLLFAVIEQLHCNTPMKRCHQF
jgi:hypothetical protein